MCHDYFLVQLRPCSLHDCISMHAPCGPQGAVLLVGDENNNLLMQRSIRSHIPSVHHISTKMLYFSQAPHKFLATQFFASCKIVHVLHQGLSGPHGYL
jgi:hypothetical protein